MGCGVTDDKFALTSEMNRRCQIAVKIPVGISDRVTMEDIELQGTVQRPKICW